MKYLLPFVLWLVHLAAHGGPIENMAAQCQVYMDAGSCAVALDRSAYPNPTIPVILGDGSVRRIDREQYLALAALGFKKDAKGRWLMCKRVITACRGGPAKWDSPACLVMRSKYRQTPP